MELSSPQKNTLKIKQKNVTINVDSTDGNPDAVIVTDKNNIGSVTGVLYIEGPGEYETKGVRISGKRIDDNVVYDVFNGVELIRIIPSSVIKKAATDDEYMITVVKKENDSFDESDYTSLNSEVTVLYGDETNITSAVKKIDKISSKSLSDHKGNIIFLG